MDTVPIYDTTAWMVVGIIFIILFSLMICVSIYLCVLRRQTINELREANFLRQQVLHQQQQDEFNKSMWHQQHFGGDNGNNHI